VALNAQAKIFFVNHLRNFLKLVEPHFHVSHTGIHDTFVVDGIHSRNTANGIVGRNWPGKFN
jgi:hypothetical protein